MAQEAITFDTTQFNKHLKEWAGDVPHIAKKVVADEARLLFADAMHLTPPFGKGKRKGSTKAAQKQGHDAIERSYYNSFTPIDPEKTDSERLREAFRNKDEAAANAFLEQSGSKWRVRPFNAGKHKANRNSKGRVFGSRNTLTFSDTAAKARQAKARTGTYKAAWGRMADKLGAMPGSMGKSRIPAWVRSNFSRGKKLIRIDGGKVKTGSKSVRIDFAVESHDQLKFGFSRALHSRVRSIKKKMQLQLDKQSDKLNKKYRKR